MKQLTWVICFLCLFAVQLSAQTSAQTAAKSASTSTNNDAEKAAVLHVIKQTFKAMLTADTVLLKSCFAPGAIMHVVQNQKDSVIVRTSRATDFIANIGKQQPGSLDERSFDEIIYIDREIATAWAPYTFHRNGVFSHKGIDSFQFVKLKDGWKIQYLMYNMYQ
jgi:16S rRNA G1207 methylase RsmC